MAKNMKSSSKPGSASYQEPGDTKRFVPLGGKHCYLRDPRNGNTYHLKVDSEEFWVKVNEIKEVFPVEKLKNEAKEMLRIDPNNNWREVLTKLS